MRKMFLENISTNCGTAYIKFPPTYKGTQLVCTYSYFLQTPSCQENQTSYDGVAFYCHRSSTQQQFQMCVPWDHSISIKCYVLVNCRSSAVLDLVLPSHNISWKTVIAGEIKLRLLAKLKAIRLINTEVKMTEFL